VRNEPPTLHLANYLKLRRGLGFKLDSAEMLLRSFIRFVEAKRAPFVTTQTRAAMGHAASEHQARAKRQPSGHDASLC
jgi:hypothetical protein